MEGTFNFSSSSNNTYHSLLCSFLVSMFLCFHCQLRSSALCLPGCLDYLFVCSVFSSFFLCILVFVFVFVLSFCLFFRLFCLHFLFCLCVCLWSVFFVLHLSFLSLFFPLFVLFSSSFRLSPLLPDILCLLATLFFFACNTVCKITQKKVRFSWL